MSIKSSQGVDISFNTVGERLSHILDQIGFKHGRGRIQDFQAYLIDRKPESFSDLKYTTVRSWFHDSAPPMKKINIIIDALQEFYLFKNDISQIKSWWKLGGYYPFSHDSKPTDVNESKSLGEQKLQFIVMSMVTEEAGHDFNSLSGEQLIQIKEKAIQLAKDFVDPFITECPVEYMRIAVRDEISQIKKAKV